MRLPKYATDQAPRSRPGFSLIELMIVVAIIAVVASLVTSATMQVISRQRSANTELTIQKVNDALKAHWRAVIDQAKFEEIPPNMLYGNISMQGLIAMAGGPEDPDSMRRARLIWIALRLKQQFPMSFMEALNPTPPTIRSKPNERPFVLLAPAPAFLQALPPTPFSTTAPPPSIYESSICLLLALSQGRKGVVPFDQDRLASTEIITGPNGLKAIADAWGRPLTFYRWPIGGEVAASNPNKSASQIIGDLLDPDALLMGPNWNNTIAYTRRGGVWAFEKLFYPVRDVDMPAAYNRKSYYTVPVVASAGPGSGSIQNVYSMMGLPPPQEYGSLAPLPTALCHDPMKIALGATPMNWPSPNADSFDNIYSFRMRLGARGD